MHETIPHFINGEMVQKQGSNDFDVKNPATGDTIKSLSFADDPLCEQALQAAQNALPSWSETTPIQRARILFTFRDLLIQHQDELAQLVTLEHGKTIEDARGSVARGIEVVEYHCGLMMQLQGTYSNNVSKQIDCYTFQQPLGVCVGISPFNFPVMVPIWMMIPAIACGNTFVLKPSEQAPSAPIRLMELLLEAGIPKGVVNGIHGDKTTVDYLITHPCVQAVTAVASTPVAEHIYTTATSHGKRAHTFGGAKNHALVMPDADLDQTANAITGAAYGSAGERCMAISVVVTVGEQTADNLIKKLKPLIQEIKIDAGDKPGTDMGPLISQAHHQRVCSFIHKGIEEGADLLIDGRDFAHPEYKGGYYLGPTLFDNVHESMSLYQNEIFGPVLIIVRMPDFYSALELVNRNQYGNGTAIFTQNGFFARTYTQLVQVGMVGVNIPIPVPVASHPFGGWKRSSFGDSNMHGPESLHFYSKRKTVTSRWPSTEKLDNQFIMPTNA